MVRKYEESIEHNDADDSGIDVVYLTPDEGMELLDRQARKRLGMSGEEFRTRYENGEYDICDHNVNVLYFLLPFAER